MAWKHVALILLFGGLLVPVSRAQHFSIAKEIAGSTDDADSVIAADLDGDGDQDVVAALAGDDKIAWYENTDGFGDFGGQQIITTIAEGATWVFAADMDGDGDQDVLSASVGDDTIAWYENTDGLGTFGSQDVITTDTDGPQSVFAADLDGDGDQDVLSASFVDDTIAWHENTDGLGGFGPQNQITTNANGARMAVAADLDGDGDLDVLSASSFDNKIAWFENTDGFGSFGPEQLIWFTTDGPQAVVAVDMDGDGDLDILSGSDGDSPSSIDKVAWHENTDGLGSFGPQQVITTAEDGVRSVFAADLDGDGDQDALSAAYFDDRFAWYQNIDGMGSFGPQHTIADSESARSIYAADLDGDGDQDAISASSYPADKIAWYENTDGLGGFGPQQEIGMSANGAVSVHAADLDGDGDQDVLSASFDDDKIAWYENADGFEGFGPQQELTSTADGATAVFAADLDGDGDRDVLSASREDDTVAWYENTDGLGAFGIKQVITSTADGAYSVFAADLDGDGDQDVLCASSDGDTIDWFENNDGLGSFGPNQVITIAVDLPTSVLATDLDGDGDQDVVSSSWSDGKIAWYENMDGLGTFGPKKLIYTDVGAHSIFAADLDGDGDQDVLGASSSTDRVEWYKNLDGLGSFVLAEVISFTANGARSVFAADLDADGDRDAISASLYDNKVAWYENINGLGVFGPEQLITVEAEFAQSVFAADLDGDGDQDVLSAASVDDEIAWYENHPLGLGEPSPGTVGSVNTLVVEGATPGRRISLGFSTDLGSSLPGTFCTGLTMDLGNAQLVGVEIADAAGMVSFSGYVSPHLTGLTVYLQAVDPSACEVSNLISHTFP